MAERKSFVLRMSPELWDAVQRLAGEELRSVNAQIEFLLREAMRSRGRLVKNDRETLKPTETQE